MRPKPKTAQAERLRTGSPLWGANRWFFMQVECQNCHQLLNLAESKLPKGRPFGFNCPFCKHKNTITIPVESAPTGEPENGNAAPPPPKVLQPQPSESPTDTGDGPPPMNQSSRKVSPLPFGFNFDDPGIQSLVMGGLDDQPKALVVYDDEEIAAMLAEKLEAIGYTATVAINLRDAAKQLKFANFAILLVQEDYFGANLHSNHLLKTMQNLDSHSRRNMLVILISPTMPTLDDLLAFSLSFDAIINVSEFGTIDRILLSIIARAKKFYFIYREVLAEHGLD